MKKSVLNKMVTLLVVLTFIMSSSIIPMSVSASGTVTITAPVSGAKVEAGTVAFEASADGAASVAFYLDGEPIAEFSSGEALSATADVAVGNREFKVVAVFDDETQITAVSEFTAVLSSYKQEVNPGVSCQTQTFDSMPQSYDYQINGNTDSETVSSLRTLNDETLIPGFSEFGWTVTGTNLFVRRVAGASGTEGDYAARIVSYGTGTATDTVLTLNGWTQKVTSGVITYDFDVQLSPAVEAVYVMTGIPGITSISNERSNVINGTDFTISNDTWVHLTYIYDVDKSMLSLNINGTPYITDKYVTPSKATDLSCLKFKPQYWSACSWYTPKYFSYFTLDNFSVSITGSVEVEDKSYSLYGKSFEYESSLPSNAETVSIDITDGIALSEADVSVAVNGESANYSSFEYDSASGVLTLGIPNNLAKDDMLTVTVSPANSDFDIVENYIVSDEFIPTISELIPANEEVVWLDNGEIYLSAAATLADNVKFYIDGALIYEFTQSTYDNVYYTKADGSALAYGDHTFKVVSVCADGSSVEAESLFTLAKVNVTSVNSGVSTEVQTFDAMSDSYNDRTIDSALIEQFSSDFGWTISGSDVYMQRVAGKSGEAGDYAVEIIPYGQNSNTNGRFTLNGFTEKVTSGIIVAEFDMSICPVYEANVKLEGFPLTSYNVITGEKKYEIYYTDVKPSNNEWVHYRYSYNVEEGTVSIEVNDRIYVYNQKAKDTGAANDLSHFAICPEFWSAASYYTKNYYANITVDNIQVYKENIQMPLSFNSSDCSLNETTFTCNFTSDNLTESAHSVFVMIASYNGDKLESVSLYKDYEVTPGLVTNPLTHTVTADTDKVCVFVWDDVSNTKPIIKKTEYPIIK